MHEIPSVPLSRSSEQLQNPSFDSELHFTLEKVEIEKNSDKDMKWTKTEEKIKIPNRQNPDENKMVKIDRHISV